MRTGGRFPLSHHTKIWSVLREVCLTENLLFDSYIFRIVNAKLVEVDASLLPTNIKRYVHALQCQAFTRLWWK